MSCLKGDHLPSYGRHGHPRSCWKGSPARLVAVCAVGTVMVRGSAPACQATLRRSIHKSWSIQNALLG